MKHTPQSLERRKVRSAIDWSCCGQTLLNYLVSRFSYRDSAAWRQVIESGEITVNGRQEPPEKILQLHDQVEYQPKELPEPPAEMHYKVVYEDRDLLVIDKPGNLCVHPAGPFFKHTLWHMLCSKYGEIHFINRLDRETSGLMIAAKNKETAAKFTGKERIRKKVYTVLVHGFFDKSVLARGFLAKDYNSSIRKKRHFHLTEPQGPCESAETLLEPLKSNGGFSLVRATLFTGRMHQIRATLCSLGYPVAGDKLYGPDEELYLKQKTDSITENDWKKLIFKRQALHASQLIFEHPVTGEELAFESPADFVLPEVKIAITGAEGFIGRFFAGALMERGIHFAAVPRRLWDDEAELQRFFQPGQKVFHFAGLSRHEDGDHLYRTNLELSAKLCRALRGKEALLYFASSPHVLDHDLPYHRSKRDSMKLFAENGIQASALLMPNTFGPGSKPFYNSVVSTFALLAAQKKQPEQLNDVILQLIPVRELCRKLALLAEGPFVREWSIQPTIRVSLPGLWERLNRSSSRDELDELLHEMRDFFSAGA